MAIGTGLIFGIVPALASGKPDLTESLKEGGRSSTTGRHRNRLRNSLVVAEVALALVLLTSAGLLIKSFVRLQNVNPGFNPKNVLTMEISLPILKYPDKKSLVNFFGEVERRVSQSPRRHARRFHGDLADERREQRFLFRYRRAPGRTTHIRVRMKKSASSRRIIFALWKRR